jgi:hypothetical protein
MNQMLFRGASGKEILPCSCTTSINNETSASGDGTTEIMEAMIVQVSNQG